MSSRQSRAEWDELQRIARALPPRAAEHIAAQWARDAQFEHASIASFGRFALELLAIGAPAALVESAHRAAIDEVHHARLCFSLASVYGGISLGPGVLPLDPGAFTVPTLDAMARATVLEGCVNETLAALEAKAACEHAEPDAVRNALLEIERQESDHASLAFRFVSWAIVRGGAEIRVAVREAFVQAGDQVAAERIQDGADAAAAELDAVARRHGRIPPQVRDELRKRALVEVIAPAARQLVG